MTEIAPDTVIDERYKVLSRIGAGGMAEVFCVQDQSLGRKVALKLLHARFASDAEFVERFRREASSAASLQHPNVVGIYDRGRWDGTYYIAMEYLPGRTLKEVIQQDSPIDPVRATDLTVQILKAARFAHRRGIVHRDLKPHNVIVDDEDRAKVTDFGIARAGASDMTETGSILGTAQYLSPEQAQGMAVSPQSDLYSVGVILFELLTGHVPFEAESAVTIALKHVSEPPPAPSAFDPSVPPELETIVLWALEKDPAHRPQDADAFIHALEEARELILAREAPGQRTATFVPGAVPLGEEPAPEEERAARRRPPWWAWLAAMLAVAGVVAAIVLLTQPSEVRVPGVVGLEMQVAQRRIEAAGLDWRIERVRSTEPLDEVVRQSPRARRTVEKGTTVVLSVSGGPGTIDVPAVDGDPLDKARAALQNAGLVVGDVIRQASDSVAEGIVIQTSPRAGANVERGSTVKVYVSTGPEQVTVPDVVGFSQADADATLRNAGFNVSVTEEESTDVEAGDVISQSPAGDAAADLGSTVTIVVATAPPVEVPVLTGLSQPDAEAALSARGLVPRISGRDVSDQAQDGIVVDQRPAAGTTTRAGGPVRIFVGRYVAPVDPGGGDPGGDGDGDGGAPGPGSGNGNGNSGNNGNGNGNGSGNGPAEGTPNGRWFDRDD
ncbi:Stk1 family PASTA domain-containing Ser/Thr kinase [Conexibacter arvalis]|uniref:non-specific serine/threonine protein kinase n=1 Tax=Conexibacter arvalis TaxID=912552 RepID=A0A840IAS8_9ACTN|nr:PASTA domain-containing protein [Conexibacter arvalis]MBB4661030.1 serine/threonine-protein kinase [Conexibacter arvalis]